VIYTLREKISHFMSPTSTQKREGALSNTWSNTILIMICALQIASALIILWLGRRIRLMQRHLVLWFIMGLTIGTPALLSFLLINKVRQKVPTSSVPNLDLEPITEFNTPASK
jgi:hypothetical protein